jgi:hypothetical protein
MAQAMITQNKFVISNNKKKYTTISTQTDNLSKEFCVYLAKNKTLRVYNSKTYKEYVLSFNFGNSKKYIITKSMWKLFRNYVPQIDEIILDKNNRNSEIFEKN